MLECNARLIDFEVINNNILDKDVLYYLGNFSPEDTKLLINNLTKTTQLVLEPALIDALVADLAGELGEVRPIELQVVGTQLQSEEIKTLEKYRERGPKEELVGRFLEEVVKDCGEENQQITKLILYLLTDENNTRPLKTRADLELELEVTSEKLDLILLILVKSGLVFKILSVPDDRYQLVHDYLVPFVRQQQSARLIEELEKEREQRKLTEAKLLKATQKQLRQAYIAGAVVTGLAILADTFGLLARIGETNSYLQKLSSDSRSFLNASNNLDALVESLKAAKQLKSWSSIGIKPKTRMQVMTALQEVAHTIRERNSLEGHKDGVSRVSFSPDGNIIASGGDDGEVKIWSRDGRDLKTFQAHYENVFFSEDAQTIVAVDNLSLDYSSKNLKFWKRDGTPISNIKRAAAYSPNFQTVVTFEDNHQVEMRRLDGKLIKNIQLKTKSETQNFRPYGTLSNNKPIHFSPNGKVLAIQANRNTIELRQTDGTVLEYIQVNKDKEDEDFDFHESLSAYENKFLDSYIDFSSDNQSLAIRTDKNSVEIWKLDNKVSLVKTIKTEDVVENVNFLADNNTVAITTAYHTAKLWQLPDRVNKEPKLLQTFPGHNNQVTGVSISPDGQLIASASHDNTIKIWQRDRKLLRTFKEHGNKVNSVSFSPDGKLIASASDDKTVKLWQADDGKVIKICEGHSKGVNSVSFSPNGKMIASIGKDNTVRLWNIEGEDCKSLNPLDTGNSVYRVSFSPDSQLIAVASENTITLWSINGTRLANFKRFGSKSVSFSPNGKSIAAAKSEGISVWDFDLNTLIKRGCNWAYDYLKNNPNVEESDRKLCDDIVDKK